MAHNKSISSVPGYTKALTAEKEVVQVETTSKSPPPVHREVPNRFASLKKLSTSRPAGTATKITGAVATGIAGTFAFVAFAPAGPAVAIVAAKGTTAAVRAGFNTAASGAGSRAAFDAARIAGSNAVAPAAKFVSSAVRTAAGAGISAVVAGGTPEVAIAAAGTAAATHVINNAATVIESHLSRL